jgi:predicted glycoside hydrolase/deacetylase ChbG (UPF0249 family)
LYVHMSESTGTNSSMRRPILIVADDAGLAPAVDRAILNCLSQNLISVAALMSTSGYADAFLREYALQGHCSVGWHVTLSEATHSPCTDMLSGLCGPDGRFVGRQDAIAALLQLSA